MARGPCPTLLRRRVDCAIPGMRPPPATPHTSTWLPGRSAQWFPSARLPPAPSTTFPSLPPSPPADASAARPDSLAINPSPEVDRQHEQPLRFKRSWIHPQAEQGPPRPGTSGSQPYVDQNVTLDPQQRNFRRGRAQRFPNSPSVRRRRQHEKKEKKKRGSWAFRED